MRRHTEIPLATALALTCPLLTEHIARAQLNCGTSGSPNNGTCIEAFTGSPSFLTADIENENGGNAIYSYTSSTTYATLIAYNAAAGTAVAGSSDSSATTPAASVGVWGASGASSGKGVYGTNSSSGYGVYGENTSSGDGVYATSSSGYGLYAITTSGAAAVYATTSSGNYAVEAVNSATNGDGVKASATGTGSIGVSANGVTYGVYATCSSGHAVDGESTSSYGVYGISATGTAVYGKSTATNGLNGVEGVCNSTGASGVYGENDGNGYGVYGRLTPTGSGVAVYGDNNSNASGAYAGYFNGNVDITGTLTLGGTACAAGCTSDRRLKQNIEPLKGAIDKLLQLHGVTYEWKNPGEHQNRTGTQTGVIAQDVEKVFPQWVGQNVDGFKTVDPDARTMVGLTVEGFRELKMENDDLRDRVKSLEGGRRPLVSGMGEGGIGLGLCAIAGALIVTRRRRPEERALGGSR